MMPILAQSSVRVVKADGSVVTVENGTVTKTEAPDQSQTKSVTEESGSSRHSRHSSSSDSNAGALALSIPIVAILCTFAWLIVRAIMAPFANRNDPMGGKRYRRWRNGPQGGVFPDAPNAGLTEEEQAILLKLQRTITQMERRIESLETILTDHTRTNEKYGTKH